jgi:hypothetical protein
MNSPSDEMAMVEVVKFRLEYDCNVYFVDHRWSGEISSVEFARIEQLVDPLILDAGRANTEEGNRSEKPLIDGPVTELALSTRLWSIKRTLLYEAREGFEIMAAFRGLASKVVPENERSQLPWLRSR